jgi:hypothetical protein
MEANFEKKYKNDITHLEKEIEDKQHLFEADIKAIQLKSEKSLAELKDFYEKEKEKQDQRLKEEREKA